DCPAKRRHAFTHRDESEPARKAVGLEPAAVVAHEHAHVVVGIARYGDIDLGGICVLERVADRLPHDAVDHGVELLAATSVRDVYVEADVGIAQLPGGDQGLDGVGKAKLVVHGRPQTAKD